MLMLALRSEANEEGYRVAFRRSIVIDVVLATIWMALAFTLDVGEGRIMAWCIASGFVVLLLLHVRIVRAKDWLTNEPPARLGLILVFALAALVLAHAIWGIARAESAWVLALRYVLASCIICLNIAKIRVHAKYLRAIRVEKARRLVVDYVALEGEVERRDSMI